MQPRGDELNQNSSHHCTNGAGRKNPWTRGAGAWSVGATQMMSRPCAGTSDFEAGGDLKMVFDPGLENVDFALLRPGRAPNKDPHSPLIVSKSPLGFLRPPVFDWVLGQIEFLWP